MPANRNVTAADVGRARRRPLGALARPADAVAYLGPNWFASVMGTGIVANAIMLLPREVPLLQDAALVIWLVAATLLVVLVAATAAHWLRHPGVARGHASDPAMVPFYGAPPMALMTVGAGALLVGHRVIGMDAAVVLDSFLWTLGTIGGLAAAAVTPYLMFTRHPLRLEDVLGSWLMPVVPPMVSAATGAALLSHVPAGQARLTLLLACYAMFGLSLFAALMTIALLWARLAFHGPGPARTVPTLWIVLGPLGQSITAVNLLGAVAPTVLRAPFGAGLSAFGVVFGLPALGFALLWMAIAGAITLQTARRHLPFSLTWWSFTFPVGTMVTGTSALAARTGADALVWLAVALFGLLLVAWATAFVHTARGALSGRLLLSPATPDPRVTMT
ncbi:TDT family transporter [Conexibacter sp. CPCC 206217]|uniref:TDT family transporter n=1 Tax=Conexibacter sp. CPCC 206217 TaxID=3064574 RepID=UPI002728B695|nr:TDT family transporter [Conexibacter sp. CPCC 206217]MDO8210207.1 TDT family transporter [Conexibacter sp. CPCC 206217]